MGGSIQIRDREPAGYIHLPKLGTVSHDQIDHFLGARQYCWVQLRGDPEPKLLSEPLAYFAKRLPAFERIKQPSILNQFCRVKLQNPERPNP